MLSLDKKREFFFLFIREVKPPPVSVVDVLPERRNSKGVLNPFHNLPAVTTTRMHALHFMCA